MVRSLGVMPLTELGEKSIRHITWHACAIHSRLVYEGKADKSSTLRVSHIGSWVSTVMLPFQSVRVGAAPLGLGFVCGLQCGMELSAMALVSLGEALHLTDALELQSVYTWTALGSLPAIE